MRFRAGSYSGYNWWRNELAKLAGYEAIPTDRYGTGDVQMRHDSAAFRANGGPFWELICFSDCEGIIGAEISANLAKQFSEFDDKAKKHDENAGLDGAFYDLYKEWRECFELASQNGCVRFH